MKITHRHLFTRKPGDPAIRVSPEDYEMLLGYIWHLNSHGYACTNTRHPLGGKTKDGRSRQTLLGMHRLIMGLEFGDDKHVDHVDGDKLDNTRENLRVCTLQENSWNSQKSRNNTSGYKGVSWHKSAKKYRAQIQKDGKQKSLGLYDSPEDAHEAYKAAASSLYGDFSRAA